MREDNVRTTPETSKTHPWAYAAMAGAIGAAAVLMLWPLEARGMGRAVVAAPYLPAFAALAAAWIVAMAGVVWTSRILRAVGALCCAAAGGFAFLRVLADIGHLFSSGHTDYLLRTEMALVGTAVACAVGVACALVHLAGARRLREPGAERPARRFSWIALACTVGGIAALGSVFYGQATSYLPDLVARESCVAEAEAKVSQTKGAGAPYSIDVEDVTVENLIQQWTRREMTFNVIDSKGLPAGTAQCTVDGNLLDQTATVNVSVN